MANFNTHLSVALVASSGAAVAATNLDIMHITDAPWMIAFGAIGGMLPDIDAGNSKPVRLFFSTLGIIVLLTLVNVLQHNYPPYQLLLMAAASYLSVRYGALALFNKFTVHRGIFHSILTAVFFCLLMICIGCYLLNWDILHCWLSGLFIGFGFIVHLLLDEMYSVDLSNRRLKKSFGTALKLYSPRNLTASLLMGALTLALVWITPQPQPLIKAWQVKYKKISQR